MAAGITALDDPVLVVNPAGSPDSRVLGGECRNLAGCVSNVL